MTDIATIAAGLTKARRKGVLAMSPHEPNYSGFSDGSRFASLVRAGLALRVQNPGGGWPYYRLTPLGQEIRQHLSHPERMSE